MATTKGKTAGRARRPRPLGAYTDPQGRKHRIVRRGRLVLDLCAHDRPRVVFELGEGEGREQALAVLRGSDIDEGYLARMAREPAPLARYLTADDVRRAQDPEASERSADRERRRAA